MKNREGMEKMLAVLCDETKEYSTRLEAYEYLQEDCEEMVDAMLEKFYASTGETADMLIEILSEYKGNKDAQGTALLISAFVELPTMFLFVRMRASHRGARAPGVRASGVLGHRLSCPSLPLGHQGSP